MPPTCYLPARISPDSGHNLVYAGAIWCPFTRFQWSHCMRWLPGGGVALVAPTPPQTLNRTTRSSSFAHSQSARKIAPTNRMAADKWKLASRSSLGVPGSSIRFNRRHSHLINSPDESVSSSRHQDLRRRRRLLMPSHLTNCSHYCRRGSWALDGQRLAEAQLISEVQIRCAN